MARRIALILILPLLLSACRADKALTWSDARSEELLALFDRPERVDPYATSSMVIEIGDLNAEQKARVEKWLTDRRLNRFGDQDGTVYASGTPLLAPDGRAFERYDYLLRKFPDLRDVIKSK